MKHRDAMFLLLVSTLAVSGCGGDSGADAGPPVATMEVTPQSGTLAPGETLQLSATAKDSNDNVLTIAITWASGDDLVATVSNMGLVTAVDEGSVNITASADSETGTATIVVELTVASVDVSPANSSVRAGSSTQLTATPRSAAGGAITGLPVNWTSDDEAVATVNTSGVVTGVGNGAAVITAEVDGIDGLAGIRSWIGVTGSWGGTFDAFGGTCGILLRLTEVSSGAFSGEGNLAGPPCVSVNLTFVGMNNAGGVPDSVTFTLSSPGLSDVPFNGNFDGVSNITGALTGGIPSTGFLVSRNSFEPTAPSNTAPEATSGAHSTYAVRPEDR